MALEAVENRFFVGYRSPPTIATFGTRTGKLLGRTTSCGDVDDMFYDAERRNVYVSCGQARHTVALLMVRHRTRLSVGLLLEERVAGLVRTLEKRF